MDVDRRHHAAGFVHGGTVMKLYDEVARQDLSVEFVRLSRTNSTLAV